LYKLQTARSEIETVLCRLWNVVNALVFGKAEVDVKAYMAYYRRESRHALHDGGQRVSARSHCDVVGIEEYIHLGMSRGDHDLTEFRAEGSQSEDE
jgi:hypothetical protein